MIVASFFEIANDDHEECEENEQYINSVNVISHFFCFFLHQNILNVLARYQIFVILLPALGINKIFVDF